MASGPKRFYQNVGVEPVDDGCLIALDGRPVRTPAGKPLILPAPELAALVAEEWEAQEETIRPHAMPLTQLANTALDRVPGQRPAVHDQILAYAETDTVCYWADSPPELVARQRVEWQPLIEWAAKALGAPLVPTRGIVPVPQSAAVRDGFSAAVARLSDLELAAVAAFASITGSLVIPLAVRAGRLDGPRAFEAALLDETYQVERWGEDSEAAARRRRLAEDMAAYARLLNLCSRPVRG